METNPFNRAAFFRDYKFAFREIVAALGTLQGGLRPDDEGARRLLRIASAYYWLEYNEDLSAPRSLPEATHVMPFQRQYPLVESWTEKFFTAWIGKNNPATMKTLSSIFKDSSEAVRPRALADHAMARFMIWDDDVDPAKRALREEIASNWITVAADSNETSEWRAAYLRKLLRMIDTHEMEFRPDYVEVARKITFEDVPNELFDAACCILQYYHITLERGTPAQKFSALMERINAPHREL